MRHSERRECGIIELDIMLSDKKEKENAQRRKKTLYQGVQA